jgi:hypothetical protein
VLVVAHLELTTLVVAELVDTGHPSWGKSLVVEEPQRKLLNPPWVHNILFRLALVAGLLLMERTLAFLELCLLVEVLVGEMLMQRRVTPEVLVVEELP